MMIIIYDRETLQIESIVSADYVEYDSKNELLEINDIKIIDKINDAIKFGVQIKLINDLGVIKINETELKYQETQRRKSYISLTHKEDGTPLIDWFNSTITVDEANQLFIQYFAESNPKADQIQQLIIEAKAYIRGLYPDEV